VAATFTVVSDTYLTAVVPANATTGSVTVTTPGGTLTSNKVFRVTPAILSFSPTSGPVGTPVTITGTSFTGTTKVTFSGVKATTFTVDSDTQITATVPTGAKTGKIAIVTPGGTAVSKDIFTVTP
jgi:expansin (peptidoglycan-binding protein)